MYRLDVDDVVEIKSTGLRARVIAVHGDCVSVVPLHVYEPWPESTGILCEFTVDELQLVAQEIENDNEGE